MFQLIHQRVRGSGKGVEINVRSAGDRAGHGRRSQGTDLGGGADPRTAAGCRGRGRPAGWRGGRGGPGRGGGGRAGGGGGGGGAGGGRSGGGAAGGLSGGGAAERGLIPPQ